MGCDWPSDLENIKGNLPGSHIFDKEFIINRETTDELPSIQKSFKSTNRSYTLKRAALHAASQASSHPKARVGTDEEDADSGDAASLPQEGDETTSLIIIQTNHTMDEPSAREVCHALEASQREQASWTTRRFYCLSACGKTFNLS